MPSAAATGVSVSRSRSRSAAGSMSELWAGTLTGRRNARRAPLAVGGFDGRAPPRPRVPAITTWPGALKFTASTTPSPAASPHTDLDVGVLQPEDGRHGALARAAPRIASLRARNRTSATAASKSQATGRHQRAEFAEAVAGHHGGHGAAAFAPQSIGGHPGREHGRLRAFGGVERLGRAILAALPQVIAQYGRCLGKGGLDHRRQLRPRHSSYRAIASPDRGRRMQATWGT